MLTIFLFVFVLAFLVFVHELGHFIMAKRAGMKVEEFGFGFPPRIFGIMRKGTVYSINWIPLGGFVKILGENGENTEGGSFRSKSFWARLSVLLAGVVMNMLLAMLLLSIVFGIGVPTVVDGPGVGIRDVKVQIIDLAKGSPAEQAGIKIGDAIRSVQGEPVDSVAEAVALVDARKGQETEIVLAFGSDERTIHVTPRTESPEGQGALGIGLVQTGVISYPWYEAIARGSVAAFGLLATIVLSLASIVKSLFTGGGLSADLAGPVGIAVLTGEAAKLGLASLLQFAAVLSVNLALINVLPLPALDGGRLLFTIIEKVRGKRVPERVEGLVHTIGFLALLILMLAVTAKDVSRFWSPIATFVTKLFS